MPTRRVARSTEAQASPLLEAVKQFVAIKNEEKFLRDRKSEIKAQLEAAIDGEGYEDEKGHRYLDLPSPVAGVARLQRQRRVSKRIDGDQALDLVARKGLDRSRFIQTIEAFDEEAFYSAVFDGDITEDELDELTQTNVSWAFVTQAE